MDQSPARRYAPFVGGFTVLSGVLTHAAARRRCAPPGGLEFVESALATFFLARVVAHEKVGVVVRDPFVEQVPGADPDDARGAAQQPTGEGARRTAGELLMCTRCLGPWAATIITCGQVFAPAHGRVLTRVLALGGANVLAQAAQAAIAARADS